MIFYVSEKFKVHIHEYPFAEKVNPILHKIILEKGVNRDKGAWMTEWNVYDIKEFKLIGDFALNLIHSWKKGTKEGDDYILNPTEAEPLVISDLWGQYTNKGDYQNFHIHHPSHWSFAYYVNTPKGSSPLIFKGGKKVPAKAGQMVLFPSWISHAVPPNKCNHRSVVSGNLCYDSFRWRSKGYSE